MGIIKYFLKKCWEAAIFRVGGAYHLAAMA